MEEIVKTFEKLHKKVNEISDAISILQHKSALQDELKELKSACDESELLRNEIGQVIEEKKLLHDEYQELMEKFQRIQMQMLLVLSHLGGSFSTYKQPSGTELNNNIPMEILEDISVAMYSKSARLKAHPPKLIKFSDFKSSVMSEEDFDKIPSYMKCRTSYQELFDFFNNVIIKGLNEKYRILYQSRSSMKKEEIDLQIEFREQASVHEGYKFITVSDILREMNTNLKSLDKKDDRNLQMLRHLQILKEIRKNHIIAYIWLH